MIAALFLPTLIMTILKTCETLNTPNMLTTPIMKLEPANRSDPIILNISGFHISTSPPRTITDRPSLLEGSKPHLVKNLFQPGFTRFHSEKCPNLGAEIKLLILVTSAPVHSFQRETIRLTWGHVALRKNVSLLFVLGAFSEMNKYLKKLLDIEDQLYGDIIQSVNLDTYSNLTLKTLSMLVWAETFCPKAHRILKIDDDMFLNMDALNKFLDTKQNVSNTIWGTLFRSLMPQRHIVSKYYMSPVDFPDKVYPDFLRGASYLLTSDCVSKLLKVAFEETYISLEDVFITGIVASKAGIKRRGENMFYYYSENNLKKCEIKEYISIHQVNRKKQLLLWSDVNDLSCLTF